MKAMILAAGLGTRLRPFTLEHPKALAEVGGRPMLGRVIDRLDEEGFDEIIINVHHFPEQIEEYLDRFYPDRKITLSDESDLLLETGGALVKISDLIRDEESLLIHNVDILSSAKLKEFYDFHIKEGNDVSLLTSGRESSRKLYFDSTGTLRGWKNISSGEVRPEGVSIDESWSGEAFSGIYIVNKRSIMEMRQKYGNLPFPIMDWLLNNKGEMKIRRMFDPDLKLIDIGKPATLSQANLLFENPEEK